MAFNNIKAPPKPLDDDRDPWERQRNESWKAFDAFVVFLRMPLDQRTPTAVAEKQGRGARTFRGWSRKWHWDRRAAAWDAEREREVLEQTAADIVKTNRKQRAIADAIINKGLRALAKIDPDKLTPNELLRFISEGVRIKREAMGLSETGGRAAAAEHPVNVVVQVKYDQNWNGRTIDAEVYETNGDATDADGPPAGTIAIAGAVQAGGVRTPVGQNNGGSGGDG